MIELKKFPTANVETQRKYQPRERTVNDTRRRFITVNSILLPVACYKVSQQDSSSTNRLKTLPLTRNEMFLACFADINNDKISNARIQKAIIIVKDETNDRLITFSFYQHSHDSLSRYFFLVSCGDSKILEYLWTKKRKARREMTKLENVFLSSCLFIYCRFTDLSWSIGTWAL